MDLNEAKKIVEAGMHLKGVACPCCGQLCKVYARKFNTNMAVFLCSLVREYYVSGQMVHYSKCKFTGRDYPYVAGWGLAATTTATPGSTKKMSGLWYPTQKGVDFVNGRIAIPSHALYFNQDRIGFSPDTILIHKAFKSQFDYQQMMATFPAHVSTARVPLVR